MTGEMIANETKTSAKTRLAGVAAALRQPTSWILLGLGFSCGLPFLLIGSTLGFWLRAGGTSLTLIGFMSWVTLLYGLKILWAPWMDKMRLPGLYAWLGQRRSYMLVAQIGVAAGLVAMALIGPRHLTAFAAACVFVTFAAASQEIAVDAWRVEMTNSSADQAFNPSFYSFGYKAGLIMAGSACLLLPKLTGWPGAYELMAALLGIGVLTTLLARRTEAEVIYAAPARSLKALLVDPFTSFYKEHAGTASLILITLVFYRLGDYLIGPVVGPMYRDTGLDLNAIAVMRSTVGLAAGFIGVAIGGACLLVFCLRRAFLLGALAGPLSNLCFSWLALAHGDLRVFGAALVIDDFGDGIAETALVAFMTRMTGRDHTLTHYALMYSTAAIAGKFLKGFAGALVDAGTPFLGLDRSYAVFFAFTAALALPTVILCWRMRRKGVFSEA